MDDNHRQFRGNRINFKELTETGERLGALVYVTTPRHLKPNLPRTFGYRYDFSAKSWVPGQFPLPHVVYNRIPYRKDEIQPDVQECLRACLHNRSVRLFNPSFFNKWTLFEWLGRAKTTKRYIPVTRKLTSSRELEQLLKSHSVLYLKPERGKAGKGIMKVQQIAPKNAKGKAGKREYWLTVQSNRASKTSKFASLSGVWSNIKQMVTMKNISYSRAFR